jgi:8-oxo-dGTP pyrophosphatase MutT (NUDIX family)
MPSYYRDPTAPTPNRPRRIGVVAVVEIEGSILLDRRSDDGSWAFLGGGVEEDESVLDALRREVREETGLEVLSADLLGVFSDPTRIVEYADGTVQRVLTVAFVVVPRPGAAPTPSDESLELRLVARDKLGARPLWPAATPIRDTFLAAAGVVVA